MHVVIETPTYLADAKAAGLDRDEMTRIVSIVAADPLAGDVIVGTGGARKLRIARSGSGKSGGYRVVSYFAADDVPVFLLALIDKRERADLGQAERNALRIELGRVAADYRAGAARRPRRPAS